MDADIFGAIPISEALYSKGVGVGNIISITMGVTVLSLPSILLIKRVVKTKLIVIFVGIVAIRIIALDISLMHSVT